MFNILKRKIPKEDVQEVNELESWKLCWKIQGNGYDEEIVQYKCFINEDEAKEYEKQLKNSAKFIGAWIKTKISKN